MCLKMNVLFLLIEVEIVKIEIFPASIVFIHPNNIFGIGVGNPVLFSNSIFHPNNK